MKLLVTSAGGTVGPLLIKMFQSSTHVSNIVAVDAGYDPTHLQQFGKTSQIAFSQDPKFKSDILDIIVNENIDLIWPLSEEDCLAVSKISEDGVKGAQYIGNSYKSLQNILDKTKCYHLLASHGVVVPRYFHSTELSQLSETIHKLGYPDNDVVIKPVEGRGSRGVKIITKNISNFERLNSRAPLMHVSLDEIASAFQEEPNQLKNYFFSEFIGANSYSVDLICNQGHLVSSYPHQRLGYKWGFVDHAHVEFDDEIHEVSSKIVSTLNLHGFNNVELARNNRGQLSVIEVNGRTSATMYQNCFLNKNVVDIFFESDEGNKHTSTYNSALNYRTFTDIGMTLK